MAMPGANRAAEYNGGLQLSSRFAPFNAPRPDRGTTREHIDLFDRKPSLYRLRLLLPASGGPQAENGV